MIVKPLVIDGAVLFETLQQCAQTATQVGCPAEMLGGPKSMFLTLTIAAVISYGIFNRFIKSDDLSAGDFVVLFTLSTKFSDTIFNIGEAYRFANQFSSD